MNRPAPRKSSLAGTSPLTPPPAPEPAPADTNVPTVVQAKTTSGGVAPQRSGEKYPRLNYYVPDVETAGRIRAAFIAGRTRYGWRTFSDMQAAAVLAVVEQLEREINDGQPFEPTAAGAVPPGRSVE